MFHKKLFIHYHKMRLNSIWVSLDFEWIWTFLFGKIVWPPNEWGPVAMDNGYFKVKYKFTKPFIC
jgi:hypothetical protein